MKNKKLLYDDNCPLCCWYSGLFVKYGLLPADGRIAFSTLDTSLMESIDFNKGRNEIPLVDTSSGKVLYGIDALLELLGQKFPLIKSTGNIKPVKWVLLKFYKLISYNRKLVVAKRCGAGSIDCAPDINYFYRFLFMTLSLLFNTVMLFPFHTHVLSPLSIYHKSVTDLQAAHFRLAFINCVLMLNFKKEKAVEYLAQVNMLALSTTLLMLPLLLLSLLHTGEWIILVYLVITATVIFKEYIRRMDYAGVLINYTWVAAINLISISGFIYFLFS